MFMYLPIYLVMKYKMFNCERNNIRIYRDSLTRTQANSKDVVIQTGLRIIVSLYYLEIHFPVDPHNNNNIDGISQVYVV